ncbi:MAG: hypothetical protein HFE68_07905 [Erysipelotrichaceae bacterium]|nr:hypothetical protein [Erysipelotrichaceae bacterium]
MELTKKQMRMYGLSIRTNRSYNLETAKSGKWTQSLFCESICSVNTLISIEKGKAGRFEDTYEGLAKKLNMRAEYVPAMDRKIRTYTLKLYEAVEYYNMAMLQRYCDKALQMLQPYAQCLWYGDLIRAVQALENHYLKQRLATREERILLSKMIGEFSKEWDEMLKSLVFCSAFHDLDCNEYELRFEEFKLEESESACNKVNTMMFYVANEYTSRLQKLYENLEQEWELSKNYIRLIDMYSTTLVYNSFYDLTEIDEVKEKVKHILLEGNVPLYKEAECNYNMGIAYYRLKQYDKAMEAMTKADKIRPAFMFIAHMQRMLNKKVKIYKYSKKDLKIFSKDIQEIYEYYDKIGKSSAVESETHLMRNILPILNPAEKIIIELVREELELLIEETKHYKDLLIFNKRIKMIQTDSSLSDEFDLFEEDDLYAEAV